MAKKKRYPTPLANILARRAGRIASNQVIQQRVVPLPEPITMEFWIDRNPIAKSAPFHTWSRKLGRMVAISDKAQKAAERAARERIMDQIEESYPQYIPHLPLTTGSASVQAQHLFPPAEDWYPGKEHLSDPDVDNLGKLIKDAPAARTKGFEAVLYWDDCPVTDDWQRKMYWDHTVTDPNYPPCPGTVFTVTLCPRVKDPSKLHCPWCHKVYVSDKHLENHIINRCPIYNVHR